MKVVYSNCLLISMSSHKEFERTYKEVEIFGVNGGIPGVQVEVSKKT